MLSSYDRLIKEIFFGEKENDFNDEMLQKRFFEFLRDIQKRDILEAYERYKEEVNDIIRINNQINYDNLDSFEILKDKKDKVYIKTHEVDTNRDFYFKENKTIKNYDIYARIWDLTTQYLGFVFYKVIFSA